jgi:hypothetical protein
MAARALLAVVSKGSLLGARLEGGFRSCMVETKTRGRGERRGYVYQMKLHPRLLITIKKDGQ